ncbi:OmpA family protein [Rhodovarius sp.]|uniref:OmpA family protein n=1 Tax=Rhodovarius sp. TaxID=2972673 RepID=UPI003342A2AE
MPRLPLASAILAMALATQGQAQQDQEAQRLIQQLSPTRGIRMPSADPGTAVSSPSLTPAAPEASPALSSTGGLASPPNQTFVPQPLTTAPMEPAAPPPRQTTAPTGVAAVSITVNFASGSASLTPQAAASLAALGRALSSPELAPYRFRIEGHTDTVGDAGLNMLLSQRRAEAVRDFLAKNFGVQPTRLMAIGMGESQLLVSTPDNMPEPSNRRVQVLNLGG